jgi:regulator of protease activity HflC (stomatin/prohibitin superfamily)
MTRAASPPHLPGANQPTEWLLDDYAKRLLAALRRRKDAGPIAVKVEHAARALRNVLHARELCERLTAHADALAANAEQVVEKEIRALFKTLSSDANARAAIFPGGLGAALAPRGMAQVSEMKRLLTEIANAPLALSDTATARLAAAAANLSERCTSAEKTHAELVNLWTAERHEQRAFRTHCHEAYGAIIALQPNRSAEVALLFGKRSGIGASPKDLPPAPPPTPGAREPRPTKLKRRAPRRGRRR